VKRLAFFIAFIVMNCTFVFSGCNDARGASSIDPPQASATYLGVDTRTSGTWLGHFGSDGYIIPGSSTRLPDYARLTVSVGPSAKNCSDPRCLETADGSSRTWNQWQSSQPFFIDLDLVDGHVHKISFYAYDFFNTGDIQNLTVKDANTGVVLSSQTLSSYNNGVYQNWEVSGHLTITITAKTPIAGLINGIFFDPPPPVTGQSHLIVSATAGPTPIGINVPIDPNYSAAQLSIRVSALPSGGRVTLSDGVTPIKANQSLTVAQLTSLKFVPSARATTASNLAYTVTDPAARSSRGNVLIVAEVVPRSPPPPNCTAAGMEAAPIVSNDSGRPISLLVPRSSILPSEIAVLINDGDQQSIVVGHYFQLRSGIPQANIIHVTLPTAPAAGANFTISAQEFSVLKSEVDAKTASNIQAYVLTWTQPYSVSGGSSGAVGITSAFAYGYNGGQGGFPSYFNATTYQPYTDWQIRPAMMLAGYTPQDVIALIDRGALAQQTLPTGTGYFIRTSDAARSDPRYTEFMAVIEKWNHPEGLKMNYIDNSAGTGSDYIQKTANILFYETGLTDVPAIASNRYRPGALADHLTSFGGDLLSAYQMSILQWLQAGVTASYGTVTEPGADSAKFPQPIVLVNQYFSGNTALEAYNKSVDVPYQGVFVGDPLARPFGTNASVARGVFAIKTSILRVGDTYSLLAGDACSGPFITLRSNISVAQQFYATITDATGLRLYYRLVKN
jgi:uncharacterized protein (TIGR03790 family)